MKFRFVLMAALAATMALAVACDGDDDDDGGVNTGFSQTQQAAGRTPSASSEPCLGLDEAPASVPAKSDAPAQQGGDATKTYAAEPPMTIDPEKTYIATIRMDIGDIRLRLFPKDAPTHVNNFVFLARDGFYDGVTFHRVLPGFMAQAGDPQGTGSGGPGYTIKDEVNGCNFDNEGTLGMAKTQLPNSAGSQFFITFAPAPHLNGGYTAFGTLIEGRDVLDKIELRDPARATKPGTKINTITIEEQ